MGIVGNVKSSMENINHLTDRVALYVAKLPELGPIVMQLRAETAGIGELVSSLTETSEDAQEVLESIDVLVKDLPAQYRPLALELLRMAREARTTNAAANRLIEKLSRKADAIPDHLFPLTVDAPKAK